MAKGMPRILIRGGTAGAAEIKIKNLYLEQSSSQLRKDAPEFIPSVVRLELCVEYHKNKTKEAIKYEKKNYCVFSSHSSNHSSWR